MPFAAPKPCRHPGCKAVTTHKSRECEAHRGEADRARGTATQRGYGVDWRKLRAETPKTPCCDCHAPWRPNFHLDHGERRRTGGGDETANLFWRCAPCHSRKTAAFDGGLGRPLAPFGEGVGGGRKSPPGEQEP
ncbi:MAG: HNH endonuclease signature motif containing protein [Alphaproteobacteria bacterium]